MTPIKSSCIVCSTKFTVDLQRQNEFLPSLYDDFEVFCQFFCTQNVKTAPTEDKILWISFSFCSTCKTILDNLSTFQGQLMALQKEIAKITTHIARKISNKRKGKVSTIVAGRIETVRKDISKHYKPRVVLSDCGRDLNQPSSSPSIHRKEDDDSDLLDEMKDGPPSVSLSDDENIEIIELDDDSFEDYNEPYHDEENHDDHRRIKTRKKFPPKSRPLPVTKVNHRRQQKKPSKTTTCVEQNLDKDKVSSSSPVKTNPKKKIVPKIKPSKKEKIPNPNYTSSILNQLDIGQDSGQDTSLLLSGPRKRRAAAAAALNIVASIKKKKKKDKSRNNKDGTTKKSKLDLVEDGNSASKEDPESGSESDDDDDDDDEEEDDDCEDGDEEWKGNEGFSMSAVANEKFKKRLEKNPGHPLFLVLPTNEPTQFQYGPWKFEEVDSGGLTIFKCMECSHEHSHRRGITAHINAVHILNKQPVIVLKSKLDEEGIYHYGEWTYKRIETGSFKCLTCSIECPLEMSIIKHITKVHEKNRPICKVCEVSFSSEQWLSKHKCCPANTTTGKYACMHLGDGNYLYRRKWTFSKVVGDDGVLVGFKCGSCDMVRKSLDTMTIHIRAHHGGSGPVVCEVCGYVAMSLNYLTKHQVIHSTSLDFVCEICARQFKSIISLKSHKISHRTERFKCDQCDKSFQYENSLRRHRASTGHKELIIKDKDSVRAFECTKCNRLFLNQSYLDHHTLKCYGKSIFPCLLCNHVSTAARFLEAHMTLVHNQTGESSDTTNSSVPTTTMPTTENNDANVDNSVTAGAAASEANNEKQDCEENSSMDHEPIVVEPEKEEVDGTELQVGLEVECSLTTTSEVLTTSWAELIEQQEF